MQAAIDVIQRHTPPLFRPATQALLATWSTVLGVVSLVYLLQGFTPFLYTASPLLSILAFATYYGITTLVLTRHRVRATAAKVGDKEFFFFCFTYYISGLHLFQVGDKEHKRNGVHKHLLVAARAGKREKEDDDDSESDDDDEDDEACGVIFPFPMMILPDLITGAGSARRGS